MFISGEPTYKIGRTSQSIDKASITRLNAYKKGSEIVLIIQLFDPRHIVNTEREIIARFKKEFSSHPDGNEYFTGDKFKMMTIIIEVISRYNNPQPLTLPCLFEQRLSMILPTAPTDREEQAGAITDT